MVDLVRRTRSLVHQAREEALRTSAEQAATRRAEVEERVESSRAPATERKDRVDISEHLRAHVQTARTDEADEAVRPKIEELQRAYRNGRLNTPERVERAAENLLRQEREPGDPSNATPEA
jgi:hypothetical protein